MSINVGRKCERKKSITADISIISLFVYGVNLIGLGYYHS